MITTDAYDSSKGPYTPGGLGGGVGVDGAFNTTANYSVSGDFWTSDAKGFTTSANGAVAQRLYVGGPVSTNAKDTVGGNGYVVGPYSGSGSIAFGGTLETTACSAVPTTYSCGGGAAGSCTGAACVSTPVSVSPPCDCNPCDEVPISLYETYYSNPAHNDDGCPPAGSGSCSALNPWTFDGSSIVCTTSADCPADPSTTGAHFTCTASRCVLPTPPTRMDLPCGIYYVDRLSVLGGTNMTIVAHGNTALFVGGSMDIKGTLTLALDPTATFDVFLGGTLLDPGTLTIGTEAYPAQMRTYVGGACEAAGSSCLLDADCCSGKCTGTTAPTCQTGSVTGNADPWAVALTSAASIGGDIYAPMGQVYSSASINMFGALFVNTFQTTANAFIHYDEAVVGAGTTCTPPPTGCKSCKDCDNQACNPSTGLCGACSSDSDCCAPLVCIGGKCKVQIM
jgi:hypothetical protein